jgi:Transposase IS116/IS110/IS902 family
MAADGTIAAHRTCDLSNEPGLVAPFGLGQTYSEPDLCGFQNVVPHRRVDVEDAAFLVQLPGIGARVHSFGEEQYGGRITKQGRRDIRLTMVEAAWVAVGGHPYWKEMFERLAVRVGRLKAIVAIARKLLLVVWHVLTKHVADREAVPEKVAGKFLEWSWKLGRVTRAGLTSGAFIRRELRRLQLGDNVTAISRGKRQFPIPLAEHADQAIG